MTAFRIDALPALSDNYIWLIQNLHNQTCAAVDPGDAAPVLQWLAQNADWTLTDLLITHHHHDHTDGIEALKQVTGARVFGPRLETIPGCDHPLEDNESFDVAGLTLQALLVPGHTRGHLAYFHAGDAPMLFSGDTLFAAGCGRIFEGTPEQMYHSLQRLARLPAQTAVYCAHEYTLSNLRFAAAVEPDNRSIRDRLDEVNTLRQQNCITLPSTMAIERATNPFLRISELSVNEIIENHTGQKIGTPEAVFAAMRQWKDGF